MVELVVAVVEVAVGGVAGERPFVVHVQVAHKSLEDGLQVDVQILEEDVSCCDDTLCRSR